MNGQGNLVTKIFSEKVNYLGKGGRWQTISNDLRRSGDGLVNGANSYDLQLPSDLDEPVRVREGSHALSFELVGAEGNGHAKGNQARYSGALSGVDAVYEANSSAVKETLVLEDAEATATFRFKLRTSLGLRPRLRASGAVDFVGANGRVAFKFAPPFMEDSSGRPKGFSTAISTRLRRADEGWLLTLRPSKKWLESPERVFPVRLDPTVDFGGANQDCYVVQRSPDTNFCGYGNLDVGYDGVGRSRSLLKFDIAPYIPQQAEILDAELGLYLAAKTTSNAVPVDVHRLTRSWSGSFNGATWNRHDGTSAWTTAGGDFDSGVAATTTLGSSLGWKTWHPTELVQQWRDGTVANSGFLLKAGVETVNNRLSFDSTYTRYKTPPYLSVTYEPRVGQLDRYEFDGEEPPDTVVDDEASNPVDPFRFDVNVANGNLLLRERDVLVEATGLDVVFERFYNNLDPNTTQIGGGWASETGIDLELVRFDDGSVAFYGPSGHAKTFRVQPGGGFRPPPGLDAELTRNPDGSYRLSDYTSDSVYSFDSNGRLTARSTEDEATQLMAYNSLGDLTSITDGDGRRTTFTYDGAGFLSKITEPGGAQHIYAINSRGRLTSYTDPAGKRSSMTYNSVDDLTRVVDRQGRDVRFTYDTLHRVISATRVTNASTGTGPKTTYAYNQGNTLVTAPDGRKTTYTYDGSSIARRIDAGTTPPSVTLSGTLAAQDNRTLTPDASYALRVDGQDSDGVKEISIDVDGDGDDDTAESPCSSTNCSFTWTMESAEFTPGEVLVRATVIDGLGNESARVLVVTVPPWSDTSDGLPEPTPPTKQERLEAARDYRRDFGFAYDDTTLEARDSDPSLAPSAQEWGVPLTPLEVQDLETRLDVQDATGTIDTYVDGSSGATAVHAGTWIDQEHGGIVKVGFTQDAAQHATEIKKTFPYPDKVVAYTATRTATALEQLNARITADMAQLRSEGIPVNSVATSLRTNVVWVGVPSPDAATEQRLQQRYGNGVRLTLSDQIVDDQNYNRFQRRRRQHPGLRIVRDGACTIAFSAYGRARGRTAYRHLTAGHCGSGVWKQGGRPIGRTRFNKDVDGTSVDAQSITARRRRTSIRIFGPAFFRTLVAVESLRHGYREHEGNQVCVSGAKSGNSCGELDSTDYTRDRPGGGERKHQRLATYNATGGDSGAPVYRKLKGRRALAVGVHSGTVRTGFLYLKKRRVYSHASLIQNAFNLKICVRGRARCGR